MLHSAAERKRACKKERNSTQVCVCVCVCACVCGKTVSHVRLFVTPWAVAYQAPPSMEFSRQEYWSGLPFPSPRDLPKPGIEPGSQLQVDSLPSEPPGKPLYPGQDVKSDSVHHKTSLCYHLNNTWVSQELLLPSPWKPTFHERVGDLKRNRKGGHLMPSCGGLAQGTWHPCQVTLEKAQVE